MRVVRAKPVFFQPLLPLQRLFVRLDGHLAAFWAAVFDILVSVVIGFFDFTAKILQGLDDDFGFLGVVKVLGFPFLQFVVHDLGCPGDGGHGKRHGEKRKYGDQLSHLCVDSTEKGNAGRIAIRKEPEGITTCQGVVGWRVLATDGSSALRSFNDRTRSGLAVLCLFDLIAGGQDWLGHLLPAVRTVFRSRWRHRDSGGRLGMAPNRQSGLGNARKQATPGHSDVSKA